MKKQEIIEKIARARLVESTIESMTHQPLDYDLEDLSQMIYLALLEQPDERIEDLYRNNEMQFFIGGIVKRQAFSQTSPYYLQIRKFNDMTDELGFDTEMKSNGTAEEVG